MGTVRTVDVDGVLRADMEGPELEGVHFTDETWEFDLVVTNRCGERLRGTIEFVSELETTLGLGQEPLRKETVEIDLEPGEVHRETLTGAGLIGGSGIGVVAGIHQPTVVASGDGETVIEPGAGLRPLLSLVIWDRDFYRINFLWPRRAQYVSVAFALLSVVLAGAIVWLSVG